MLALADTRLWLPNNLAQVARASMVAQAKDDEYRWVHGSFTEFRPWPFSRHGFKHEPAGTENLRCDSTVKGGDENERKVRTLRARNCVLVPNLQVYQRVDAAIRVETMSQHSGVSNLCKHC